MPLLASTVLDSCRTGLLNDPSGAIFADTPMYSLMNKAYRELQTKVRAYGVQTTKKKSAAITVNAGTNFLGDGAGLPADFIAPIRLKERALGSTNVEDYVDMDETSDELLWKPIDRLAIWCWREEKLYFPPGGSTVNRDVLITYNATIGTITGGTSPIIILDSDQWLAQRTAILASLTIGGNPKRAEALKGDLEELWDDLKITLVRRNQNRPVRRRRTRFRLP